MLYVVAGRDPERDVDVKVEIGFDAGTGYFFGVDHGPDTLAEGVEIRYVPELIDRTRQWVSWDRKLYQAMRDAPVMDYAERCPADPVSKILSSVR